MMDPQMVMSPENLSDSSSMSDNDTRPSGARNNLDHAAISASQQSSTPLKRKFGDVDPARPTPAKKRLTTFVDGHYPNSSLGRGTQRLKRAIGRVLELYNYQDCILPEDHIRLLFLKPHADREADIVVELRSFPINELVKDPDYKYTALSYNWGNDSENKVVLVDMLSEHGPLAAFVDVAQYVSRRMKRLNVKPNLHAFLQEFRRPDEEVALWVDRICINQTSNAEKQDQVSRMNTIYSTAAWVSIWLGPADEDRKTDRAMEFIRQILENENEELLTERYAKNWSELLYLMRRRWFSRRWIIQELALAKNAEVRCGSKRIHWRDFSDAVSICVLHFDTILGLIKKEPELAVSLEGIKDMKPLGARILVDVLANTFQRQMDGTIFAPRQGLESLISSLSTFETSDPRDTVYTLLNLAKETFKQPPSSMAIIAPAGRAKFEKNPPPVPDYNVDLLDVYTTFVKWCIQESGSLDILCRHWALPELKQKLDDFYPRLVELPTWIKTVRDSAYGAQTEGFGGRRTGDSFVGTPETRCYNASLGMTPVISFGRDEPVDASEEAQRKETVGRSKLISSINFYRQKPLRPDTAHRVQRPQADPRMSITVKGLYLGQVAELSRMPEGIIPKQVLNTLGHQSEGSELDAVSDTVWRTLVADRDPNGKMPPAWYQRACMSCLVADTNGGNIDTNYLLQPDASAHLKADYIRKVQSDYLKRVQAVCWNRTFIDCDDIHSERGRLFGIAPSDTQRDDLVCILYGCSVPCILRPTWRGNNSGDEFSPDYYQLVGEAFILGRMDGEAIVGLEKEELKGHDFRLM